MRKQSASTQNRDGSYWGAWVVTDIDEMRCAVFTSHSGLQNATIRCVELGHLYNVEIVVFVGELPTPSNLQTAIKQMRDDFLTEEKIQYFNYLKGVRDGRLMQTTAPNNPTMTLKERLDQLYTSDRRTRYEHD